MMLAKPCPHCGRRHGVSHARVAFANRFSAAICKACKKKFAPAMWQGWLLGEILLLPASFVGIGSASPTLFFTLLIVGIGVAVFLQQMFIPLVQIL